ncbi:myosin [Cryptosporidium ubiquitum]|uniref:Myosin n=1 Tax=Cryptosporidium ubiquitum TaxID=857276 RepID=A0A1J4MI26_9CRYT|nr:myosin [Cryptosporidium ubiquitum]OII72676.1 myosin [Cryptosporidium ubiquitum]
MNDIKVINSPARKVKRSRNEFAEDLENDTLYLNDYLKMNNRKKVKGNKISDVDEPMKIEETRESISNNGKILQNEIEKNDESDNNSPLLCTSTMRGQRKRYSIYYISGNNSEPKDIEGMKSLQDELVEAEFIDDILKKNNSEVIYSDELLESENGYINDENEMSSNIKTGIKRPTVFIPNLISNIKQNNSLDHNIKTNTSSTNQESLEIIDSTSKKISLKDVQENFRNNIIKQRKQQ